MEQNMVKYLLLFAGSGASFSIGESREPTLFLEEKCNKQKGILCSWQPHPARLRTVTVTV